MKQRARLRPDSTLCLLKGASHLAEGERIAIVDGCGLCLAPDVYC